MAQRRGKLNKIVLMALIVIMNGLHPVWAQEDKPKISTLDGYAVWGGNREDLLATAIQSTAYGCKERRAYERVRFYRTYVRDVVVWLTPVGDAPAKVSSEPRGIDLHTDGCDFMPRVMNARIGDVVHVKNSGENPQWMMVEQEGSPLIDQLQIAANDAQDVSVSTLGVVELRSALHHWLKGYLMVVDTPYAAVVNDMGHFAIESVPEGEYDLHAWHPILGETVKRVSLPRFSRVEVRFDDVIAEKKVFSNRPKS